MIVGLALSKWLTGLVHNRADSWNLSLLNLYVYRVHDNTPDMFSFAFRIEPPTNISHDVTGLTVPPYPRPIARTEIDIAAQLVHAIADRKDIDEQLQADPSQLEAAIKLTEDLLRSARYDVEGYREWVEEDMRRRRLIYS